MRTTPARSETPLRAADAASPAHVSFGEAFRFWLKLGFISFGGPAGQIAIMHQELVERRRWISERRFLHALNYCMVLPGPEAQQLATYIGWLMHRTWGGIVAGGLFILPSLFILLALSWIYMAFGQVPWIAGMFYGLKPAVTAIVLFAAYRIGSRVLNNRVLWAIAAASFIGIFALGLPFPFIIAVAALAGWIGERLAPATFAGQASHAGKVNHAAPALIDDHTPTPPHAQFAWTAIARVAVVGLALWAGAISMIGVLSGIDGVLARMSWFFTKAALLTFGGAYAVLPYVFQGAVEHRGWLTAPQMIDGLALGETTPGPLIMVVTFVGFVGGWSAEVFGPGREWLAGVVAGSVVTYFTFLPSFVFILAGGPIVEGSRQLPRITAPLNAITAAVVGVIVNLAVFFGYHVLWPAGFGGSFQWPLLVIGIAAGLALFRFRVGVIPVLLACGVAGLVWTMVSRSL
jgi:chromate transporter